MLGKVCTGPGFLNSLEFTVLEMGRSSAGVMVQCEVLLRTAAARKLSHKRLCECVECVRVCVCVRERDSGVCFSVASPLCVLSRL